MATGDKALVMAIARERVRLLCAQLDIAKGEIERALIEMRSLQAQLEPQPPVAQSV